MSGANAAPARHLQQDTFAKILDAWGQWTAPNAPPQGRLSTILAAFSEGTVRVADKLAGGVDVDLADHNIWIVGTAVQKGSPVLFPVATASVWEKEGALNASVRVALLDAGGGAGQTRFWGWRYDSAEQATTSKPVARPHAHAQPTTSWYMTNTRCMLHPHPESESGDVCPWYPKSDPAPEINETHPALPLRGDTLPGLALSFVVSLYGTPGARAILETDPTIMKTAGAVINTDLTRVLGGP